MLTLLNDEATKLRTEIQFKTNKWFGVYYVTNQVFFVGSERKEKSISKQL